MTLTRGKTAILIILLVGSSYYGYSKYRTLTPSPAINNGHANEFGGPRRIRNSGSPEDKQRHEQFVKALNLTPEQQAQMKALREQAGKGDGRDRFTSFSQILTPQQRAQMAAMRDARRDKGAKAALSSADFEKYRAKRDEMRKNHPPRIYMGPGKK